MYWIIVYSIKYIYSWDVSLHMNGSNFSFEMNPYIIDDGFVLFHNPLLLENID